MSTQTALATKEYKTLDDAYTFFNKSFFDGKLPACMITYQNKSRKNLGYFWANRFKSRGGNKLVPEIALNSDNFEGRSDREILSTLVHEMCHAWQFAYGKPSRNGYHNKEWGTKMKECGLYPSNTGSKGGKETGQQMTHYILSDGNFVKYATKFLSNTRLHWSSIAPQKLTKINTKVGYVCIDCDMKVWGKAGLLVSCGYCKKMMVEE